MQVPVLELLQWIRTRWASLYLFLDRILVLQKVSSHFLYVSDQCILNVLLQAVNRFIQLADDSDEVPDLKDKKYRDFRLSKPEWKKLELMREVLRVSQCLIMLLHFAH